MTSETKVLDGAKFEWKQKGGTFAFEGEDAILFWLNSAFKTFLDTLDEVSGEDAASVVLETTGYRMGLIVGEHFFNTDQKPEDVLSFLPAVYSAAGWGNFELVSLDSEESIAVIRMRNSWEYRVNKLQNKKRRGTFIPGHFAGMFSGFFNTNIWYDVLSSQAEGEEYCEFVFAPSEVTVIQNIHDLSRQQEQKEIAELEKKVIKRTEELSKTIKDISSPIIPVLDQVVVVPLLGRYDEFRSKELVEKTTQNISGYRARYLLLDLTGLSEEISEYGISMIRQLISVTHLLGMETVLVGISPELSMKMTKLSHVFADTKCFSTLQHGITYALKQEGLSIC
ncbi:STAS domain-containing protein [Alteribacter natronophilus]|uniref:STAS domain-containing protein n=1 Tax=Alteribacter natronophilus TaxID=2583810 RepID=UPI00110EA6D6|nr:STAS domain-containing protein [Alteribacter natronophilus]TMW72440.1 STAS domain-containing protein [Alteribacter natronophilus]